MKLPEWVDVVKTGCFKELPPNHMDWLYQRMAAVIRRVYMREPSGVGALARRFGGKNKRRGVRPNKTGKGSRKIIRHCLQTFEKLHWMEKAERGRKMTRQGKVFMDEFSLRIRRSPMVTAYWKRRAMKLRLKKKLQRKRKIEKAMARAAAKEAAATAGNEEFAEDGDAAQQNMEMTQGVEVDHVVEEFD